jgi:trehalose 6-phosphate synthase
VTLADLLVVSNRGPISFRFDEQGLPQSAGSAGGLAGTLHSIFDQSGATWVACALNEADRAAAASGLMTESGLHLVMVEPDIDTYQMAYDVISNSTLWFAHHHLFDTPRRPKIDRIWMQAWDAYRDVNTSFCDAVDEAAAKGAVVLVQDYHLSLVPGMLKKRRPDLSVVHFSHTPFADPSMFLVLPTAVGRELLEGMAGARACGFHSPRWEQAFLACCDRAGVEPPATFVSALAPDASQLEEKVATSGVEESRNRLRAATGDRLTILKVDRVEPSKNLLRGLWAIDELLSEYPRWRGRFVHLAFAYPSRQELPEYLGYRTEVELLAQRVNDNWGTADWTPVLLEIEDDHDKSMAALSDNDVLLVNPLRDGMNLVAKEGPIVNRKEGVLALSTEAGAYDELAEPALCFNPFDVSETAAVLDRALAMPKNERASRSLELRRIATRRRPMDWLDDQLAAAKS